uniref:G-protein coupled receptors family 1 profile domain-containing protein n=1 Tax=Cyprinodon variegatus TaxID=28743 RepID=A0A3Q2DNA2_CYPVA
MGNGTIFACQHFDFSIITGYLFIIITIISIIGNIILMWVLLTFKKLNLVTKIFMMNLACSDLIFALTLPFWATYHLKHWIFGDFLCKFIIAMYFTGMYSSIICLTAMSVDRFFIVVLKNWPNNDRRKKTCTICVCVATWVISIGTSVYDASKVKFYDDYYHCESSHSEGPGYDIQVVLLFFIPFAILIFCHCAIIGTILQATNRSRHRALTIVFFIVVAYIICWGPYNVYLLIESWYQPKTCDAFQQLDIGYNICRLLAFSHCCMNPLLCLLIQKLRNHLFCLLRKMKERDVHTCRIHIFTEF